MAIRLMALVWRAKMVPCEKLVLLSLADRAGEDGHCWPSLADTERRTGVCRRHIQRCIASIELAGHLTVLRRSGRSSIYIVHPRIGDTGDEGSPVSSCPATSAVKSLESGLQTAQTIKNHQELLPVPRPDLSLEDNLELLELINRHSDAEKLRAWLRQNPAGRGEQ